LTTHKATTLAEAAWIIELYRRRWIIEQLFRTLKSQGLDLEDSLLSDGEALERLAATALIAAANVMQLVQGRGLAGARLSAARVFSPAEVTVLEPLIRKFEGKTAKQKNPQPQGEPRLGGLGRRPPRRLERLRQRTPAGPDHLRPRPATLPRHRRRLRPRRQQ
jgi:hypothetical protein